MTDMRATERLLEMLDLRAETVRLNAKDQSVLEQARAMLDEIRELRRRGDTLVRADDLRKVMDMAKIVGDEIGMVYLADSNWVRLENALGGKLR